MRTLSPVTRCRLEMQGIVGLDDPALPAAAPWLRLVTGLCATWAGVGTLLQSAAVFWTLVPLALLGAPASVSASSLQPSFRPSPTSACRPSFTGCSSADRGWRRTAVGLSETGIAPLDYDETEHVVVMRRFMNDRARLPAELLRQPGT